MKILITDGLAQQGIDLLLGQGHKVDNIKVRQEDLADAVRGYHAMIVRSRTKVTKEAIQNMDLMLTIGRAGIGTDNIDVKAANEMGIQVVNAPNGNTIAAAELAVGLMLTIGRNIAQAYMSMAGGRWLKKQYEGVELYGKTIGILGCGKIGSAVADRLKAFQANVIGYDPYCNGNGLRHVPLDQLLQESDFVTMHTPNLDRPLIGHAELEIMKKTSYLINTSRGKNIEEKALYDALAQNRIAGAALDVFTKEAGEGEPYDNPLLGLPNFVGLPHLGASTKEAQIRTAVEIANNVIEYLKR
ncbi:MAG: hydroxyacid dehydrogenase [Nanoarchaeota archaeon]|nr:hydroxyacid dehydrogenase [Nanoarchaeota archaeon]